MKKHLLFFILLVVVFTYLSAEILRVNPDLEAMAEFTNFDDAYNTANIGDTLLLEGGTTKYGNQNTGVDLNLTKKLTILGPGYYHQVHSYQYSSGLANIYEFYASADSSHFSGFNSSGNGHGVFLNGDYCVFKNCYLYSSNSTSSTANRVYFGGNHILFFQNWANLELKVNNADSTAIYNNLIKKYINATTAGNTIVFNNVIQELGKVNITHFYNNIIEDINLTDFEISYGYVFQYNIFGCPCPPGSGLDAPELYNVFDVDLNTVFTYGAGDMNYQLIPGSIAEGAGLDGVDCGMFGGPAPYILGGMPPELPAVSNLEVIRSNETPDDLNIIFEAKTHPRPSQVP